MGLIKYRSLIDYAQIYSGTREGMDVGLDSAIFIREELTQGTFITPRIGTQGQSEGDTGADTDISAGTDNKFNIAVDGATAVLVTLSVAGLTSGALIEAALESTINAALAAAGQDGRVWVHFDAAGPDQYTVYSQKTGTDSSVVITNNGADNIADDLLLGVANGGTEAVGTNDQDALLYTTGGPNFSQPVESNAHRSGRFHSGIVKSKKVVEFTIGAMINFSGSAGDSLDNAVRVLMKGVYGTETVNSGVSIVYTQGLPSKTFSIVRVSTIFGEYYNGAYVNNYTLTVPGAEAGTREWTGGGMESSIAGIGQVQGAVVASATVQLNTTPHMHARRYSEGSRVMAVNTDGRTIKYGADGALLVNTVNTSTGQLTLSASVSLDDNSYIVPWHPGAVQMTVRDNIQTDLEGSVKLFPTSPAICATNISLTVNNDHQALNNCFGSDHNEGFVASQRNTMTLSLTVDLSGENLGDIVQSRLFGGFQPVLIIGDSTGRHEEIAFAKWIPSVPPIDPPENGTTSVTLEGICYQSAPGARDPITDSFK